MEDLLSFRELVNTEGCTFDTLMEALKLLKTMDIGHQREEGTEYEGFMLGQFGGCYLMCLVLGISEDIISKFRDNNWVDFDKLCK